ncbi:hypothetical protein HAX54_044608 [Datura stramonium]|uniref:Uncharacterized protein n=1 Tax=Datura stramonium TaxID=4076 RepID=A0ABS8WGK6_DATST|nr:hypothetical protein [Datura stramonium]
MGKGAAKFELLVNRDRCNGQSTAAMRLSGQLEVRRSGKGGLAIGSAVVDPIRHSRLDPLGNQGLPRTDPIVSPPFSVQRTFDRHDSLAAVELLPLQWSPLTSSLEFPAHFSFLKHKS